MKNLIAQKKQLGFSLVEVIILLVIFGFLASTAIPAYQNYMTRTKWAKAIVSIAALKLAIGECLENSKGNIAACNDFSAHKLGKYHATIPTKIEDVLSVSVVKHNAAIRIAGANTLGLCILDSEPSNYKPTPGYINWKLEMRTSEGDGDSVEKCRTYVKCG